MKVIAILVVSLSLEGAGKYKRANSYTLIS